MNVDNIGPHMSLDETGLSGDQVFLYFHFLTIVFREPSLPKNDSGSKIIILF